MTRKPMPLELATRSRRPTTCRSLRSRKKKKRTCARWLQQRLLSKLPRLRLDVSSKRKRQLPSSRPRKLPLKPLLLKLLRMLPIRLLVRRLKPKRLLRMKQSANVY
jgi:hypothetical protein